MDNVNTENQKIVLVINGSEIARRMPLGHANAIFIQDAFIFWNHLYWIAQSPDAKAILNEMHLELINNGLLKGIDVVNNLFDNQKFIIDTIQDYTDYTQEMYAERKRGRRTTSLNLRYNFGKQQKKKWDRRNFGGRGGGGMDMDY